MAHSSIFPWVKKAALCAFILILLAGCAGPLFRPRMEPVTLRFLYLEGAADYAPLAEKFHRQNPDITIQLYPQKFDASLGEALKDIQEIDAMRLPMMLLGPEIDANFMPLDSLVSTAKKFPFADLYPGSLDGLKLNGKQMGIPAGLSPFVVYYLPKKFAGAGVQPPAPDWTLADFQKTAVELHNLDRSLIGKDQYGYGFCSHPRLFDIVLFTYLQDGGLFDSWSVITRPTLNRPENVAALTWYTSLQKDFHLMPDKRLVRDSFIYITSLDCWFWIDGLGASAYGNLSVPGAAPLPIPVSASGKRSTIAFQDGYYIGARSSHSEAAFQWLRFLMEQPGASGRLIPPLKSQIKHKDYTVQTSPAVLEVARRLSPDIIIFGIDMNYNQRLGQTLSLYSDAAYSVFIGESDAKTALDSAQREAEAAFR